MTEIESVCAEKRDRRIAGRILEKAGYESLRE